MGQEAIVTDMKGREERSNYPCLLVCSFVSPSFFLPIVLTKYKNQIKTGKETAVKGKNVRKQMAAEEIKHKFLF